MRQTIELTLLLALAVPGCDGIRTWDDPSGVVTYDAGASGGPDGGIRKNKPVMTGEIAPVYGFVSPAAQVEYYYLGEVDRGSGGSVPLNAIYFFYDENGQPLFRLAEDGSKLVGWHPVVDVVPTKAGYSPYWRVHRVRVKGTADAKVLDKLAAIPTAVETCQMDAICPTDQKCIEEKCRDPISVGIFELDGIKSHETLSESKLLVFPTSTIINCPIVDASAKLLKGISNPDLPMPRVQLWYKRLKAFCYLMEGGKQLLGAGAGALPADRVPPIAEAYFIRRELSFGTSKTTVIFPKRTLVLTAALPGSPAYSPLVSEKLVTVDQDYAFKDLRSVADAKARFPKITSTNNLHNLVVRGTVPSCKTDDDCAATGGKVDPPLKCSVEQGYCSPPFARLFEECRGGVKECDPKGGPSGGRLACVGLRIREKYFCFNACDSTKKDGDPDKDVDTRCGSIRYMTCYPLRQTDPSRPNGLCFYDCNSRVSDKTELHTQCVSKTCGDGKLQHWETCDDGNKQSGDGCNEFCTLSTFTRCDKASDCKGAGQTCKEPFSGQGMTYCLPPPAKEKDERADKDKYRVVCTEYDFCWPPDVRADWLGKKEVTK